MLEKIGNFILEWAFRKLWAFLKRLATKFKIGIEVDKEEDEVEKIRKEIFEYMEAHPEEKRVPKHLEDKLNDATKRRNSGLSDGI